MKARSKSRTGRRKAAAQPALVLGQQLCRPLRHQLRPLPPNGPPEPRRDPDQREASSGDDQVGHGPHVGPGARQIPAVGDIVGPAHQEDRVRVLPDQQIGQDGQHTAGGVAVDAPAQQLRPGLGGAQRRPDQSPREAEAIGQAVTQAEDPPCHRELMARPFQAAIKASPRASLTVGWGWIAWISSSAVPSAAMAAEISPIMSVTC